MKRTFLLFSLFLFSTVLGHSCKAENLIAQESMTENTNPITGNKLKIKVGVKTFTATILDTPTAKPSKHFCL